MRFWRRRPLMCRDLVELITDYLEGTMPARDRARFDRHLAGCDGCTAYLEQMRITIRLTGRLDERQLDPDARAALLHAFQGWARSG
jgi:anti-sigma factor RsiW